MHCRLKPDRKGGFVKDGDKSWKVAEDPRTRELFINFGAKNENEGDSKTTKRLKRTADGACKNGEDDNGNILVTVVTPLRCDKAESVSCRDVIRDIAGSKPHYLGPGDLGSAGRTEKVSF